jgi:hypothetical protein
LTGGIAPLKAASQSHAREPKTETGRWDSYSPCIYKGSKQNLENSLLYNGRLWLDKPSKVATGEGQGDKRKRTTDEVSKQPIDDRNYFEIG